jgi:hypothetical protein
MSDDERSRADGLAPFLNHVRSLTPDQRTELVDRLVDAANSVPVPPGAGSIGTPSGFRYQRQAGDPSIRYFTFERDDGSRGAVTRQMAGKGDEMLGGRGWFATDALMRAFVNPPMEHEIVEITEAEARELAAAHGEDLYAPRANSRRTRGLAKRRPPES